jgi:hypothetical protein
MALLRKEPRVFYAFIDKISGSRKVGQLLFVLNKFFHIGHTVEEWVKGYICSCFVTAQEISHPSRNKSNDVLYCLYDPFTSSYGHRSNYCTDCEEDDSKYKRKNSLKSVSETNLNWLVPIHFRILTL